MVLKAMLTVSMASLVLILSDNLKETIFLANIKQHTDNKACLQPGYR